MSIGKVIKVGRPSIAESDVPPHIQEGLLHKRSGKTWKDSATAVGLKKYQTLKEWVNKNKKQSCSIRKQYKNVKNEFKTN